MPELPEVEIFKRSADASALHKRIRRVRILDESLLKDVSRRRFTAMLREHSFVRTHRHGKYLGISLSDRNWVVFHFGMTGELVCFKPLLDVPDSTKLVVDFVDGSSLAYLSRRKLGMITVVEEFDAFIRSKSLGPDALSIDNRTFQSRLQGRRGAVKSALMNQSIIAGIGNIYSDEILFQARVSPMRQLPALSADELKTLYRSMKRILRIAIERRANPQKMPSTWILSRRGKGQHCPRCSGKIVRLVIAGRHAYFCPNCQR